MIRASQKELVQEANLQLVAIRNAEIVYFNTFFLNFGTQASVVVAAICGSLSQTPAFQAACPYPFKFIYFQGAAIVIAIGIHLMIITIYAAIFAEGKALRGPQGSMVSVIDGLVAEQQHVVTAFVLMMITFVILQQLGMNFVVMDILFGTITSVGMVLVGCYTYHCTLRIYNRFHWDKKKTGWDDLEVDPEQQLKDLNPSAEELEHNINGYASVRRSNYLHQRTRKRTIFQKMGIARPEVIKDEVTTTGKESPVHVKNPLIRSDYSSPYYDNASLLSDDDYYEIDKMENVEDYLKATVAGYLTVKIRGQLGRMFDPWVRRYFVIRGTLIYYYKDQNSFHEDAGSPINIRPIDLEGYGLIAGATQPPYTILLVPLDENDVRKSWKFRCDTSTEFQNWVGILSAVLRAVDQGQNPDEELIRIGEHHLRDSY